MPVCLYGLPWTLAGDYITGIWPVITGYITLDTLFVSGVKPLSIDVNISFYHGGFWLVTTLLTPLLHLRFPDHPPGGHRINGADGVTLQFLAHLV